MERDDAEWQGFVWLMLVQGLMQPEAYCIEWSAAGMAAGIEAGKDKKNM